jgi:hypothetical protein
MCVLWLHISPTTARHPYSRAPQVWLLYYGDAWYICNKHTIESAEGDFYRVASDEPLPEHFGWEAATDGQEPVPTLIACAEGPAAYAVEGAGAAAANGIYYRDGTYDGSPLYRSALGQLVLVRARTNRYRWMIADKDKLNITDGDLYQSERARRIPLPLPFPCHLR